MVEAKRARTAETPKPPSFYLTKVARAVLLPDDCLYIILSNVRHLAVDALIEPGELDSVDTGRRR